MSLDSGKRGQWGGYGGRARTEVTSNVNVVFELLEARVQNLIGPQRMTVLYHQEGVFLHLTFIL